MQSKRKCMHNQVGACNSKQSTETSKNKVQSEQTHRKESKRYFVYRFKIIASQGPKAFLGTFLEVGEIIYAIVISNKQTSMTRSLWFCYFYIF